MNAAPGRIWGGAARRRAWNRAFGTGSTTLRTAGPFAAALLLLLAATPAAAQAPAPLEQFVRRAVHLWEGKAVDDLVDLVVAREPLLLDSGGGAERVNGRHAAAALRSLFADRETVSVRASKVTVSGGQPVRGYGELTWVYRSRGRPGEQTSSVYLGAVWDGRNWRISELRLIS